MRGMAPGDWDRHLSIAQERHDDPGSCLGCGGDPTSDGLDDDGLCPDCAPEDERPVGEVPPYIGRQTGTNHHEEETHG